MNEKQMQDLLSILSEWIDEHESDPKTNTAHEIYNATLTNFLEMQGLKQTK